MRSRPNICLLACFSAVLLVACTPRADQPHAVGVSPSPRALPAELPGLQNVIQAASDVYAGSAPQGDAGFDSLVGLNIRSVISVDGVRPDLARTSARNLRVVHVPIQYHGIDDASRSTLALAFRDLPRPIYVHCHHGLHRGPTAAAYGLIATGEMPPERGSDLLRLAGTSPEYAGLYEAIRTARSLDNEQLRVLEGELSEHAVVTGFVESMASIDRRWHHLSLLRENDWAAPVGHPDLVAVAEAGMVHDLLRNVAGDLPTEYRSAELRDRFEAVIMEATRLEDFLHKHDHRAADVAFDRLSASCTSCHAAHRDR